MFAFMTLSHRIKRMRENNLINTKKKAFLAVLLIYFACFVFRAIEYFLIRTDHTFFGELFIHKLIGIGLMIAALFIFHYRFEDIGFKKGKSFFDLLKGLGFGVATFILAYGVEIIILVAQNRFNGLDLYVSSYSANGNFGNHREFIYFLICVLGNVINVLMEEGVFRGLFQKMLSDKYKWLIAAIIASVLFGFWHIMSPLRSLVDKEFTTGQFIGQACMLIGTSALVGFKFAMMGKITGNLYMAMGDHFVNNTIVNILHTVSDSGDDKMMVVRIAIAQSVSFIVVLIWFVIGSKNKKKLENKQLEQE